MKNMMKDSIARRQTADLRSQLPVHRTGRGFSESGVPELAWLRGHHSGVHDAYQAIRRSHPEAAAAVLRKFSLRADGRVG